MQQEKVFYFILLFYIFFVKCEEFLEYQLIMEDEFESNIQKPISEMELTAEEENELKAGICKIVYNEPNTFTANAVFKRNEIALNKIEKNMYLFILSESIKDYAKELKQQIEQKKMMDKLTTEEKEKLESAMRVHCDLSELRELYEKLIALPFLDKYKKELSNVTNWERFVAIQLDRVYDYVNTHFNMFKKELLRLKNTKAYYERKNFFRKQVGKSILMHIFYEWLENTVCKPRRIDEHEIRLKLNDHLKWVVSLPTE